MNARSQMKSAELAGGVALVDTSAERPMRGAAKTARVAFDDAGFATSAVLDGGVKMWMQQHKGAGPALTRDMAAERVTLTMERVARQGGRKGGTRVAAVHAQGGWARGEAVVQGSGAKAGGLKTTLIAGDDLRLTLGQDAAGKDQPQSLSGAGHTGIEQKMPDGTIQTSTADTLEARFVQDAGRGLEIASAEQSGDVRIESVLAKPGEVASEGVAERAELDGATNVLTLMGKPRLTRGDTTVTADTIRMMQQTGDAAAEGSVAGTFVSANAKPGAAVTHAMAAEAVLHKAAQTMELKGTDAAPARMWQGASQVQAANILLDRGKDEMQAWPVAQGGLVRAVFAEQGTGNADHGTGIRERGSANRGQGLGKKEEGAGERVVRVTSARLEYSGRVNQAVFTGGVLAEGEDGTARGQRAVVFLTPKESAAAEAHLSDDKAPPQRASSHPSSQVCLGPRCSPETPFVAKVAHPGSLAGSAVGHPGSPGQVLKGQPDPMAASVERIVMSGGVKVEQPGRTATGEQLLYTAGTGEFVLTGHPAHVADDKQGNMTGATLLFRSPDSTIVVAGEPASRRVHTEMTVKK